MSFHFLRMNCDHINSLDYNCWVQESKHVFKLHYPVALQPTRHVHSECVTTRRAALLAFPPLLIVRDWAHCPTWCSCAALANSRAKATSTFWMQPGQIQSLLYNFSHPLPRVSKQGIFKARGSLQPSPSQPGLPSKDSTVPQWTRRQ